MNNYKRIFLLLIIFSCFSSLYSQEIDTEEVQERVVNLDSVFDDVRRFEILSFGSMPFVTLDVTLAYSAYKFFANGFDASAFNIFSSKNYTSGEITGILTTSAGISVGIAITDLIINIVKRNDLKKKQSLEPIEIIPEKQREIPKIRTSEDSKQNNTEGGE